MQSKASFFPQKEFKFFKLIILGSFLQVFFSQMLIFKNLFLWENPGGGADIIDLVSCTG